MIVIMRDQMPALKAGRGARALRSAAIAKAHVSLLQGLQADRPRAARSFQLVNGFSTSLSQAEVDRLSAQPDVLAVVPDHVIRLPKHVRDDAFAGDIGGMAPSGPSRGAEGLCNTLEPEALQLTHTAFLDPSAPQAQGIKDAAGRVVTGSGVKVAILADGLDTSVPGFTHQDGSKVFVDYQDFTGDPAGTPTAGGEMFGDASSIAAQDMPNGQPLTFDISTFVTAAHPLPSPCNIRIRGMAPGASLVGLKVFSNLGYTTTSSFVQAVEYAALHDADVINESLGSNPYFDSDRDPISLANAAAVGAGVTVVVSTGDAGTAGTLGSPATEASVIAAGASTQFRFYAQTTNGMYALANGFTDNNVSSFSSAGFAQRRPRTTDLLAPGDASWALCSTNQTLFTDCSDFNGSPSAVESFSGTSESAPIIAGAAALVIQAYRSSHGGASPSPALVKSILMSSAADLAAASDEQGAGLLDSFKAVNTALSVADENGVPPRQGTGLLAMPNSAALVAQPGDLLAPTFLVTNTGTTDLQVSPTLETLGAPIAGDTRSVAFDPATAPTYVNVAGGLRPYVAQTFTVPAGADHLDASIAFPATFNGAATAAALLLLDPSGRQVAYSNPQGTGSGYGHVDVVKPVAGKWTALLRGLPSTVPGTFNGPFQFTWAAERFVRVGRVFPQQLRLAPGRSAFVAAELTAPSQAGDLAAAIRFRDRSGSYPLAEIPVTVRTMIPVGREGGDFTGTLTGGNGRADGFPTETYALDVPGGLDDLSIGLQLGASGYTVVGYLVDPNGMILSSASNIDPAGAALNGLQVFAAKPEQGRWSLVLQEATDPGTQTSLTFRGHVALNAAQVSAPALPTDQSVAVSAATGLKVAMSVANTGGMPKAFFADSRLDALTDLNLDSLPCSQVTTVPGACNFAWVPTRTKKVSFRAQSSVPLTLTAAGFYLSPELYGRTTGDGASASLHSYEVQPGPWYMFASQVGPYTAAAGVTAEPVTTSATATTQPFDTGVSATTGDFWADVTNGTATYQPLVLAPGATGTITLTIKPDASKVGQAVRGFVYLDTFNENDQYGIGEEVVRLPYAYTVAK
jgi:hypothetical protein